MQLPLTGAVASRLEVLNRADSTNTVLRDHAEDGDEWPHLSVVLTDDQTAGRGRLGRVWTAPRGASIAVSVLLRSLPESADVRGWIPLIAGVAMADAVAAQLPDRAVEVKWPNDVLVDGGKICGILAEATSDAVIVGTGINIAMTASQLPVPTATSFAMLGAQADVDRLVSQYLRGLDSLLGALAAAGDAVSSGVHAAVTARCATIGRDVRVSLPGDRVLDGRAVALDSDGRLVVRDDEGADHSVAAGDVVHVRPATP